LVNNSYRASGTIAGQRGQAAVEFALVIALLIFLLMGMFDLGRGIYAYNVVAGAAREGARFGITAPTDLAGIKNVVVAKSVGIAVDPNQVSVTCTDNGGNSVGDCLLSYNLTVRVPYTFQPATVFFASFTVTGKSTMVVAYHP